MKNTNYMRLKEIPEKGIDKEVIFLDTYLASKDSMVNYKGESTAKPGTSIDQIASYAKQIAELENPNGIDREMFPGSANREKDYISMISRLFGKEANDPELDAGFLLSGGTESINQISYMLRNKFFYETLEQNVRIKGLDQAIFDATLEKYKKENTSKIKLIKPKIFTTENPIFSEMKSNDIQGSKIEHMVKLFENENNFKFDSYCEEKENNNQKTIMKNKHIYKTLETNGKTKKINEAIFEATLEKYKDPYDLKLIKPRILMPINLHFSGIKSTDLQGLGVDKIVQYELDQNFDIDENSLRKSIEKIYQEGDDIMFAYGCGGDTTRGKVHDMELLSKVLNEMSEKYNKNKTPIIVDAAGSYMFIGMMKDNPKYTGNLPNISFKNENIEGIIGDPHKQPLPYSMGLLMLKSMDLTKYTDIRGIINPAYLDMTKTDERNLSAALATIPTSRSGSNAFAAWAYLANKGKEGLREEKEKIWENVNYLKELINKSSYYEIVCEPQTQVVSFKYKGNPEKNKEIYKTIKECKTDFAHISYDETMCVRKISEKIESETNPKYSGLFATIMEHNTKEHIEYIAKRLDEVAKKFYE
jgi:glutamate/tyrosine decarboxylase-like PLP-dependent enzyme